MTDCFGTIRYLIQEPNLVTMEGASVLPGLASPRYFFINNASTCSFYLDQRHTTRADAAEQMMLPLPCGDRLPMD